MSSAPLPILLNAVIAANSINPSIFSQYWLIKEEIFKPEDFTFPDTQAFTPIAVQFQTPNLEFLVIPERVQVNLKVGTVDYSRLLTETLGKITKKLPHTPYKAIGFNMNWRVGKLSAEAFGLVNRKVFFNHENNILESYFTETNCRFGSYLSKDFGKGRLRLTINPLKVSPKNEPEPHESLDLNFNFNLREEKNVDQILDYITSWNEHYDFAQKIATDLNAALQ